ncbi:MAG: hydantoinase B/oxoprolinase family protein [Candidatus Tectomicrobia bacterium]|uniref:Hydantoinase B/oxoprolinase family protein n=1 Tax=Tectimicrobiota bacterium TaxID=2528274 RepID=A0A932CQY5_UNCTE|nr:hydantoinase B/oxoprolinase family protein [Candidatus Tectomicrobia bacterium]
MRMDAEILASLKPNPLSPREKTASGKFDAVELTLFSSKMEATVTEGFEIFVKMGAGAGVVAGDCCTGIYTGQGDIAVSFAAVYLHAVLESLYLKHIVKYFKDEPTVGIKDGDIFFANESTYGGVHNPDMFACMPVLYQGDLIAWVGAIAHEPETGAIEPGGIPPSARTRYDEGMRITPIKIGENFMLREDLLHMMENFCYRDPRTLTLDTKAKVAACMRMRQRLLELVEERGLEHLVGGLARLLIESEAAARRKIARWNDGTYRHVTFLDSTGREDKLLQLATTLVKQGDQVTVDFHGTSPKVDSIFNAYRHLAMASLGMYLFGHIFWDLPPNAGAMACFDFVVPQGCVLDPEPEDSICGCPIYVYLITSTCQVAFSKMVFDSQDRGLSCVASWADHQTIVMGAGINQWGNPSVALGLEINAAGSGARPDMDGADSAGPIFGTGADSMDTEFYEREFPLFYLWRTKHQPDSGGFGKYRGGSGWEVAYGVMNVPQYGMLRTMGIGSKFPGSFGLFGGYGSGMVPGVKAVQTNLVEMMARADQGLPYSTEQLITERKVAGDYIFSPAMESLTTVRPGDIFMGYICGGGGYGDVLERDPELVMKDLRAKLVSDWAAQNIYRVAYDPATFRVDHQKTEEWRQAEREQRKRRGKPYAEFEQEWSRKRPKEAILTHYGTWPVPEPVE